MGKIVQTMWKIRTDQSSPIQIKEVLEKQITKKWVEDLGRNYQRNNSVKYPAPERHELPNWKSPA